MNIPHQPFYYIRHGETDWNRRHIVMGHKDIPLNEKGIAQAQEAKALLLKLDFGKIYASPLQRARQTAEIIKKISPYPVEYINHLKERGWGEGEGISPEILHADSPDNELKDDNLPRGTETYREFEALVILAFKEILLPNTKPPLVVGHGGVFRVLSSLLANSNFPIENCVPYFFRPPEHSAHPSFIVNLKEEEM